MKKMISGERKTLTQIPATHTQFYGIWLVARTNVQMLQMCQGGSSFIAIVSWQSTI